MNPQYGQGYPQQAGFGPGYGENPGFGPGVQQRPPPPMMVVAAPPPYQAPPPAYPPQQYPPQQYPQQYPPPVYQQPRPPPAYNQPPPVYQQPAPPPPQQQMAHPPAPKPEPKKEETSKETDPLNPGKVNGYKKIEKHGLFVKQEVISPGCCSLENTYSIFAANEQGEKRGTKLLYAKQEPSSMISRCCVPGDCQAFDLTVFHAMSFPNDPMEGEKFLVLKRPCSCVCACFGRPTLEVYYAEGGKETLIGYIVHPCTCCNYELEVQDSHKNPLFRLVAGCSQLGLMCKCFPCAACTYTHFDIQTADYTKNLANLNRKTSGCCAGASGDRFHLEYPSGSNDQGRALLLAAVLFLDMRFFQDNNTTQNAKAEE